MDTRDKAIKPSKYDFSTVFRLKENRQNLIHGMCHVLVVLHELTLLYTMQKRRDPKIFPPSIEHSDLIVVGIFQAWKKNWEKNWLFDEKYLYFFSLLNQS